MSPFHLLCLEDDGDEAVCYDELGHDGDHTWSSGFDDLLPDFLTPREREAADRAYRTGWPQIANDIIARATRRAAPPAEVVALGSPFHTGCRFCGASHPDGACNQGSAP